VTTVTNPSVAPGELELVRSFVNTLDIEAETDELASARQAAEWLSAHGWPARVRPKDLTELVALREALRDLASGRRTHVERDAATAVDAIAARHPLVVRVANAMPLQPSTPTGTAAFVERTLALVATARIDGSWERLKACVNDRCRWLFYDYSRNRSRTWCSMDVCGSRAKMREYRRRRDRAWVRS
jgi:predicted RNA-binding Zn ribbon-like protein